VSAMRPSKRKGEEVGRFPVGWIDRAQPKV
jgi:hypothetical protein